MKEVQGIYSVNRKWNKETGALEKSRVPLGNVEVEVEDSCISRELYGLVLQEARSRGLDTEHIELGDGRTPRPGLSYNWITFA